MAKKKGSGIVIGILAAAAGACAGHFAYKKYRERKEREEREAREKREAQEAEARRSQRNENGELLVRIEIPGILTRIDVKEGDHVTEGQVLGAVGNVLTIEAPKAGTIEKIYLEPDQMVSMDDVLLTLRPDD